MRSERWMIALSVTAALVGCDSGDTPADAGSSDAGPPLCGAVMCSSTQACINDVCVDTCGADLSMADADLEDRYTVVRSVCRTGTARAVATSGEIYEIGGRREGMRYDLTLSRFTLDPSGMPGAETPVAMASLSVPNATTMLFTGNYLELGPGEARALWGYTTTADGYPGSVVITRLGSGNLLELDAPGNFDVAWINEQNFVVNGAGLDGNNAGQGVYIASFSEGAGNWIGAHAATNIGDYSGAVVVLDGVVIAAGVDEASFASHAYVLPIARLAQALESRMPIDVANDSSIVELRDESGMPLPSTFELVGERLVTAEYDGPLIAHEIVQNGETVTLRNPETIATGTFQSVHALDGGRWALEFAGGMLIVSP